MRFRGFIDRVDDTGPGSAAGHRLQDGGTSRYTGLSPRTHTSAAPTCSSPCTAPPPSSSSIVLDVEAGYWFVTDKGKLRPHRLPAHPGGAGRGGRGDGGDRRRHQGRYLPGRPPVDPAYLWVDCWYCAPDGLSTAEARRDWERKRFDPLLSRLSGARRTGGCRWHPPDAAVREAVRDRLDETMFVEAGAGSGKTTCLVERFVALVESGVEADRIAAITFTEKAAGELADRIRNELQKRSATSARCRAALPALDRAAICTLHAFAQRLLNEHPIEAGLPPAGDRPRRDRLPAGVRAAVGGFRRPDHRRPAAGTAAAVAAGGRGPRRPPAPGGACSSATTGTWSRSGPARPDPEVPPLDLDTLLGEIDAVVAMGGQCRDGADRLLGRLDEFADWASDLRAAVDDDSRLERLSRAPSFAVSRTGRAGNWPDINRVRDRVKAPGAGPGRDTRSGPAGVPRAHRRRTGPLHGRPRPRSAGGRASWSSTTCWCWPGPCCATPCTGWRCGRRPPTVINGSCSTSSRTPIPSRSSWRC